MQIDDVMALVDEYVSASIEDHGYRSGAASAEYLEDTKRKLLAAIAALIAAPAAPQQAEPVAWRDHVEQRMHNWRQRKMNRSGDRLALDDMMSKESIDDLIDYVCDEWSDPVAPQQAEPVAWMAFGGALVHAVTRNAMDPIEAERFDVPLYLHPPAAPQQAEPVEIVPRVWRETLRKLTFMARTSGGTPGPDEGLQTACAEAETLLSKPYNYPPAAPQQAEPVAQIGWADEFSRCRRQSAGTKC